jgi:hypothetical protein
MRLPRVFSAAVLVACLLAATTPPALAWTPGTQIAIGEYAASIAPPDLARQIARHPKEFRRGLLAPFEGAAQAAHMKNPGGQGTLDRSVANATQRAIDAIVRHKPFAEIVFELGVAAHFIADANNPLNSSDANRDEATYFTDYLRYVDSARERYPIVFYAEGRDLRESGDLELLLTASLERGRSYYPMVAAEYERIGRVDGISLFDDRSTAFGIGSLALSHAVSDIAAAFRYVWLEAGGGDHRQLGLTRPHSDSQLSVDSH